MLLERFDVAAYGPQTMAFLVSRERLEALRNALRGLYAAGDLGPYRLLWNEVVPPYQKRSDEARWLVPAATVERLCGLVQDRLSDDLVEKLRPALADARAWLGENSTVRIRPETWFWLEDQRSRIEGGYFFDFHTDRLSEVLSGLPTERRFDDDEAPPEIGDVGWLPAYRAELEGRDAGEADASAIPEWIDQPHDALDEAHERLNTRVVLEALVGPFQTSRGPGPFMGAPRSSRPIEDRSWHWLRAKVRRYQNVGRVGDARFLEGAALKKALVETERATPNRAWWFPDGKMTRAEFDEAFGGGHDSPWLSWEEVQRDWPRCRARFLALLAEAIEKDAAVLLVSARIDPQGPGTLRPVGPEDGVLAYTSEQTMK